jgi:hypothetical protein
MTAINNNFIKQKKTYNLPEFDTSAGKALNI